MRTVSVTEAKTHFSQLLKQVENGERILITRRGVSVAVLQSASNPPTKNISEAIRDLKSFGARHSLKGLSLKKMIHEGRD